MWRMINVRLLVYFDQKLMLSTLPSIRRKAKLITIDHHPSIEVTERTTQTNNEHVVSVCLYMEKAFDLSCRHSIFKDLNEIRTDGRMLNGWLSG